jgi:hypothetical protein
MRCCSRLGFPTRWLYWLSAAGAAAMLLLGYCAMGRTLLLLPWNRANAHLDGGIFNAPVITRRVGRDVALADTCAN